MVTKQSDPFSRPHTRRTDKQIAVGIFLEKGFCANMGGEGINILLYHTEPIKLQRHLELAPFEGKLIPSSTLAIQTQQVDRG